MKAPTILTILAWLLFVNYNCARATKRWPMVLFYAMLNVSTINSQVTHTANNQNSKLKRRHFIENLAMKLIEPGMRERQMQLNLPRSIRLRLTEILNIDECHRCQLYSHAATNCHAPPRCVKCLDPHWTKECTRTRVSEGKPACCNCGSDHTANYGGCPVAPKLKPKNSLNKNVTKVQQTPHPLNVSHFPALNNGNKQTARTTNTVPVKPTGSKNFYPPLLPALRLLNETVTYQPSPSGNRITRSQSTTGKKLNV
ncbi:Nucleic-acid-binding protein from transposon X-element [Eumeta japonica]|uniref:Nucleic-acid-binding protein from transposon X-element n=1 Tax=Eumeta variegata TaxID=151549 RepID=A0A4C1U7A1_EUMVA|nr:Nucleic-acid-binding protein from transposon X-element [Eumeta japonica]